MAFAEFKKLPAIISLNLFSSFLLLNFFLDSDDINTRSFVLLPQVLGFYSFGGIYFVFVFGLGTFYCFVFKFPDSFLYPPNSVWRSPLEGF